MAAEVELVEGLVPVEAEPAMAEEGSVEKGGFARSHVAYVATHMEGGLMAVEGVVVLEGNPQGCTTTAIPERTPFSRAPKKPSTSPSTNNLSPYM